MKLSLSISSQLNHSCHSFINPEMLNAVVYLYTKMEGLKPLHHPAQLKKNKDFGTNTEKYYSCRW